MQAQTNAEFRLSERLEFGKILMAAGLDANMLQDFMRSSLDTIAELASLAPGQLCREMPDPASVGALHDALREGSTHGPLYPTMPALTDASKAQLNVLVRKLTMLCRLVGGEAVNADKRVKEHFRVGVASTPSNTAAELTEKNKQRRTRASAETAEYLADANATYNSTMTLANVDPVAVVDTRIALEQNTFSTAPLQGGKYSKHSAIKDDRSDHLAVTEAGTLEHTTGDREVVLKRNASVLKVFWVQLTTIVVAGHIPIDPLVATLAGMHGKIKNGTGSLQVQFPMWNAMQVLLAFVNLSAVHTPAGMLERITLWVVECDNLMRSGHSLASASASLLGNAAWMRTGELTSLTHVAGAEEKISTETLAVEPKSSRKASPFTSPEGTTVRKGVTYDSANKPIMLTEEAHMRQINHLTKQLEAAKNVKVARGKREREQGERVRFRDDRGYDRRDDRDRDRERRP